MANAALMQISVNGDSDPVDSEISIDVGDFLSLDITGSTATAETVYFMMAVDAAEGAITGDDVVLTGGLTSLFPQYYTDNLWLPAAGAAGDSAISGTIADLGALSGTLVDLIGFECLAAGDALVTLYGSADTNTWTAVDTVTIHQIPEPMTMALLGLGGLLLRRRK